MLCGGYCLFYLMYGIIVVAVAFVVVVVIVVVGVVVAVYCCSSYDCVKLFVSCCLVFLVCFI